MNKDTGGRKGAAAAKARCRLSFDIAKRFAVVVCALFIPVAQTAQAVDVYYARAIGQDFLPEAPPPAAPSNNPREPEKAAPAPALPSLGTSAEAQPTAAGGTSLWTKVIVGVVVVGAIAALGKNGGGGSGDVAVGGAAPAPPPANPTSAPAPAPTQPPTGGGGGINIGIGGGDGKGGKK